MTFYKNIGTYLLFVALFFVALCTYSFADTGQVAFSRFPMANLNKADTTNDEVSRIRIQNRLGGEIDYSTDKGRTWTKVGSVIFPNHGNLHDITDEEFTAADWAPMGSIAAVAVNAIHVKSGEAAKHASAFSIHPYEIYVSSENQSYESSEAAIFTDIHAGTGIFSEPMSPRVGDAIYKENPDGSLRDWTPGEAITLNETLVIVSRQTDQSIDYVEFENTWGGMVSMHKNGKTIPIARVFRPFRGTGRFGGTHFQSPSKIRANHPGVICISTSPLGELGGFQIVPNFHANEPTLDYVVGVTAYMIIGALKETDPGLEGTFPLFDHLFRPGDQVKALIKGKWVDVPTVSGLKTDGLKGIDAIRIYPNYSVQPNTMIDTAQMP